MCTLCIIAPCVRLPKSRWQVIGCVYIMFGILQVICIVFGGGIFGIIATVLWFVSGLVSCIITDPAEEKVLIPVAHASTSPVSVNVAPMLQSQSNEDNLYSVEQMELGQERKYCQSNGSHAQQYAKSAPAPHTQHKFHHRTKSSSHYHADKCYVINNYRRSISL